MNQQSRMEIVGNAVDALKELLHTLLGRHKCENASCMLYRLEMGGDSPLEDTEALGCFWLLSIIDKDTIPYEVVVYSQGLRLIDRTKVISGEATVAKEWVADDLTIFSKVFALLERQAYENSWPCREMENWQED